MDWESARVSLLLARYDDQLTAVVAEDTPAAEAVHEAVFDHLMRPAPTEVYAERPELTAESARVQTADRLLGLHRDRLAAGLTTEEPAGPRAAALGRQLALVLRLLARLRGRHALLAGTLHGRALTWLRGLETELLRLRRRPLAAGQLSALRRQLAALERQLPRGEQLLAALRRAAGPAAADAWCAPLESRLAELTADLGAWSAYVSYVSAGWRRQQHAAAEAGAGLQRLERLPAGGAAAEEETAALAALEGHLDEADRQRAALNGALTPEDERTAAGGGRPAARAEELHSDWLERKSAAVRGQGQTSLCTLLTYLQNELPAQLLTASGDCDQLERERAARLDKINSLLETVADFEQMTPALEAKLAKIELILDEPVEFETGDKKEHHAATKKNDEMLELVRDVSRKMGDISGLCDLLMSDTDGLPEAREVRTVTQGGGHLQQRWARICELSAGRRQRIADAWSSAGQLGRELREFESRLSAAEERLAGAAPSAELVPRDRVRTDLETVSRAAEELEQQAAAARGVSRLLRAGLRRRHLAADGALAEGAAAATGRWLQLREQAAAAAERLRKHAAVQEHTDSDWAELESGAEQLHERARLLLLEANAGGLLNGPAKLAELTADRDALAARLDSVTRDTVSLLQTTAPEEASSYDLRPPAAYHRLTEAFGELHSALGAEGEEETDAAADPLSRATDEADSCLSRLEELLAAESPAVPELAQTLGACSSAADLVGSLSHQRPEGAEPRAAAVRERYERLRTAAHGRLHAAEEAPLQWELDRWRLQQWLQHTANKLDNMPSAESLRKDDVQLRRFNRLCVELEAHTELLAAVVSAGHQLPEGAATGGRPVRQRLTELQTEWDAVCGRLVALQSELLSIAPPDDGDAAAESGDEEARRGLLARTATLMWRVARVALPVQALLLLGLAVMALYGDRDADCASGANNFAASMQTMLNYPDGGPPM
ncbi:Nesprin-2 [Amphibalanus amphitrite]|uniref:Nesprin-2 n=1 Tax=Amphibalanus amphitrite TaxID=1232801 RepID=A0A6A4XBQ6_AMPAM|nr:Nesprin-2 [Amphibalanus amphitrite]